MRFTIVVAHMNTSLFFIAASSFYGYSTIVYLSMETYMFPSFFFIEIICRHRFLWWGCGGKYTGVELPVIYFAHIFSTWTWFSGEAHFCSMQCQSHLENWRALCGGWNYQNSFTSYQWFMLLVARTLTVLISRIPTCSLFLRTLGFLRAWQIFSKESVPGRKGRNALHFMTCSEIT